MYSQNQFEKFVNQQYNGRKSEEIFEEFKLLGTEEYGEYEDSSDAWAMKF